MSQAEALLQSMTEDVHTHEHTVTDHDSYFVIDPDSRVIENASQTENTVMQYDHNSEKFTFELHRYVEGHDMTLCNRVRVHFNNVDGETNEENADVAELYDLAVCPDDSDKVRFSWSITRQATQLAGTLNFLVQFECIDDAGASVYEWHTDIYTDVVVKKGRNNAEQAVIEYSNVLEQWYQRIFGAGDSVIAAVAAEGDRQKEAIARKAEETLATIPEDYTTTHNMAEEALRRKANAIELDAEGESIIIDDSSDAHLLGLNVKGRSEQVSTTGKNLCPGYKKGAYDNSTGVYSDQFTGYYCSEKVPVVHGTNYVISNGLDKNPSMIHAYDADDNWLGPTAINKLPENVAWIGINYLSSTDLEWMQVELGTESTEYEPYSSGIPSPSPEYPQEIESAENPTISIFGKNFVNVPESYTFTQFASIETSIPAGRYIFSFDSESHGGANPSSVRFADNDVCRWFEDDMKNTAITLRKPETRLYFYSNGTAYNDSKDIEATINRFMVSKNGGDYEPYKPVQHLTVNRTLRGIPVTSGGNYTDANGQQWICDEVDFERGVFVQRVGHVVLDGSDSWVYYNYETLHYGFNIWNLLDETYTRAVGMSNQFGIVGVGSGECIWVGVNNGNIYAISKEWHDKGLDAWKQHLNETPLEIIYARIDPIETPLTEEEIAYYKKLKTYYHNTTVIDDHGAHMTIKYAADTEIYLRENQTKPTDEQIQSAVNEYLDQNGIQIPSGGTEGMKLIDRTTGTVYTLYVDNGKLTMVKSEV